MPAGNFTFYHSGLLKTQNGEIDFDTHSIAAALLTASYTPNVALHSTWADVSASEVTDVGYAQQAVTGKSITQTTGTVKVDCDDISFGTNVTITAKYLVLFKGTAGAPQTTDPLLGYVDLNTSGGSVSSTNGQFVIQTPNGLWTVSAA